eukprot:Gb_38707 [translate_table: standard]
MLYLYPVNVTAFQLEEKFKKFGAIKPNGVQVRSKQGVFCYGFVEFEVGASVQSAIEASLIMISGRQAYVKEKRPSFGTQVTCGYFVSARGGLINDGIRGRGAYGSRVVGFLMPLKDTKGMTKFEMAAKKASPSARMVSANLPSKPLFPAQP